MPQQPYHPRHEFSAGGKRRIAEGVCYQCGNPECAPPKVSTTQNDYRASSRAFYRFWLPSIFSFFLVKLAFKQTTPGPKVYRCKISHVPSSSVSFSGRIAEYRLREHRHEGYKKLIKNIATAKKGFLVGTKFDRLFSYRLANLHYLVVEEALIETHEVPVGWGLLIRQGERLHLLGKPTWRDISVEEQLIFLQRIALARTRGIHDDL